MPACATRSSCVVEHRGVERRVHLHIALQARGVLLLLRLLAHLAAQRADLAGHHVELPLDRLSFGILRCEALRELRAAQIELDALLLQVGQAAQRAVVLLRHVDGVGAGAVLVERFLGAIELLLHLRQLGFEKAQRARGVGRMDLLVVIEVGTGQCIEKAGRETRIGIVEADADHARLAAGFLDLEVAVHVVVHRHRVVGHQLEARAGQRLEHRDLQRGRLALHLERHRGADLALGELLVIVVEQHPALGGGVQPHRLAELRARHRDLAHAQLLATPGEVAHERDVEWRRHRGGGAAREVARVPIAEARHAAGHAHVEIGARLGDGLGHDLARAQDLQLALDEAGGYEVAAVVVVLLRWVEVLHHRARPAAVELHQRFGAVHGRGDHQIQQPHHEHAEKHRTEQAHVLQQVIGERQEPGLAHRRRGVHRRDHVDRRHHRHRRQHRQRCDVVSWGVHA
jgi:hypothetical protein